MLADYIHGLSQKGKRQQKLWKKVHHHGNFWPFFSWFWRKNAKSIITLSPYIYIYTHIYIFYIPCTQYFISTEKYCLSTPTNNARRILKVPWNKFRIRYFSFVVFHLKVLYYLALKDDTTDRNGFGQKTREHATVRWATSCAATRK